MATQADLKKRLKALMNKPENQVCSDCPERQPRWASLIVAPPGSPPGALPMGAFCCLECSGSHRRLGVHISFVRSVNLDQWKEREVVAMETGGNKKVNAVFEARLDDGAKPSNQASGSVRERFIRDKYERRKYFDPDALQNVYVNSSSSEDESEDEQEVAPSRVVRAPSDAAKKRAEIRQGRLASTPRTAADKLSTNSSRVPAKQKKPHVVAHSPVAPPEVDLLQFSSSPTVVSANHHLTPAPSSAPIPTLDLFKDMNLSDTNFNDMGYSNNNTLTATHHTATKSSFQKKKMTADEILAMFNNSSPPTGNDPPRFFDGFGTTNNNTTVTSSGVMSGPSSSMGNGMQNFMSVQQQGSTMTMMQQQQNFTMMQQGGTMSQKSAVGNTTMTMTLNNAATNQMANNIAMQQPLGNDGFGLFGGTTNNGNIMTPQQQQQQQVVPMGGYPNNFNAMGVNNNNNNNGGWAFNPQHGGQQQQQQSMFLMNNGLGRMNNNDGIMGSNSTTTGGPWSVVGNNNNNNNTNNPQEDHFFASFGGRNGFGTS